MSDASQMCWMHLKKIGECGCDFEEVDLNFTFTVLRPTIEEH